LLNGGPGATHEYFECFENFLLPEGVELIYYDQLGCGLSDNPKDTSMWDLGRYVEEVEQVRKALNLNKDNFYLLGHSWGGILAMQYALKYQDNLKGLIISNMMSSCPLYGKYAQEVLAPQFDQKVLDTIRQIEAKGDFANPKYMELLMPHFYAKHICRLPLTEWPEPMTRGKGNGMCQRPDKFGIVAGPCTVECIFKYIGAGRIAQGYGNKKENDPPKAFRFKIDGHKGYKKYIQGYPVNRISEKRHYCIENRIGEPAVDELKQ